MKAFLSSFFFILCIYKATGFNEWTGVAFSPYTKQGANWNDYTYEDVREQLRIVGRKFKWITTYSMGVNQWNKNGQWDRADANCWIARAASELNMGLKVSIGVYQSDDKSIEDKEIENAYKAAADANSRRSGTVWGIVYTNEYVVDQGTGQKVLQMLRNNKNRNGLKVGLRIHTCGAITNPNDKVYGILREIAREADFIQCNMYPVEGTCRNGDVSGSIRGISNHFKDVQRKFREINSRIEIQIGETGWASQGRTFNSCQNNVNNMKNFWWGMGSWAEQNKVRTHMFEAINEPWKGGEDGEKHFGWWWRNGNGSPPNLVEKASQ